MFNFIKSLFSWGCNRSETPTEQLLEEVREDTEKTPNITLETIITDPREPIKTLTIKRSDRGRAWIPTAIEHIGLFYENDVIVIVDLDKRPPKTKKTVAVYCYTGDGSGFKISKKLLDGVDSQSKIFELTYHKDRIILTGP